MAVDPLQRCRQPMKVLVFVDHDILCRHFLMNGALAPLVAAADVRFVFPDDEGKRIKIDPAALPLGAPFERLAIDAERQVVWRWMLYADQLRLRGGAHERAVRRIRWRSLGWKAAGLLTLAGLPGARAVFKRMISRRLASRPNVALGTLLDRERPHAVLHPTVLDGVFINDLVVECRARGTPLVLAMNSWDNPATKRAVVGNPDWLLVWGKQTCEHARRFMGMDSTRTVPFGAAQFDVFRENPRIDRGAFAAQHGIDPASRIVLFAGSNAMTDEFAALSALDQAIDDGRLPGMSVVYRPHPWGGGGRDGNRLASANWRHVKLHHAMRDYVSRLASGPVGITLPDYRDTHDLLSTVDVVISPLSTILLEAALHAKPIVVYAPSSADGAELTGDRLPLLHFEDFLRLPGVALAKSIEELVGELHSVADPVAGDEIGRRLKKAAEIFVASFERPWRERLVDFLRQLVAERAAGSSKMRVAAE